MTIEVAATRSNLIMSKLIRGITRESVSHCVIIIDNLWVIHSNFKGVQVEYIGDFTQVSEIVDRIEYPANKEKILAALEVYHKSKYDYLGMLFSGLCIIIRRICPKFTPKQNLWQTTGMFLCTEFVSKSIFGKEDSMITPGKLMAKIWAIVKPQ